MNTRIMAVALVVAVLLFVCPSWVSASEHCAADLNGDGVVGPNDLAMLLGSWGPCAPGCGDGMVEGDEECDPPDGVTCNDDCQFIDPLDCCFPHDEAGCDLQCCESSVCADDPFCCVNFWAGECVVEAAELCPECHGFDCCSQHSSQGCTDISCETVVCEADLRCCFDDWNQSCADLAAILCPQCMP